MSRFLEEVEEGVVCVLMLCEKGARGDDDVPLELQEALSEFDDLMSEDLPLVCRSWRYLQHHIDFMSGSIKLSKPTSLSPQLEGARRVIGERIYLRKFEFVCCSCTLVSK